MALIYEYLLLEDSSFLLQETTERIIVDSYEEVNFPDEGDSSIFWNNIFNYSEWWQEGAR